MKSVLSAVVCALWFGICCFAQDHRSALERVKEIKLLQDDRLAVRQILSDYVLDSSSDLQDDFSLGDISIEVFYSTGTCDEDEEKIWDVKEGLVVRIEITADYDLKIEDTGVNLAKLEKEQMYHGDEDRFIYHNKKSGFATEVSEGEVARFILFPAVTAKARTCETKYAKEFVSMKSWFGSKKLEDRFVCILVNGHADVTDISLSHNEISPLTPKQIKVSVIAVDPENDVLTYVYIVSAGKITGSGANVVWDLTGAGAGTHKITAGVDDGCGLCGQTITKTIMIK